MNKPSNIKTSWWRRRYQAIVNYLVVALRWRFGLDELNARITALEQQVVSLAPTASTWAVTSWIEQATLQKTPLVSVILATHNRSRLLSRAVESVKAQDYPNWEIVLVDDGSTDDTPNVIRQLKNELGEERLKSLRIVPSGVCAARNHGLSAARGEYIAYLDDDNMMNKLWLKAVVWAFLQRPDVDVLYGGIIVDDLLRVTRQGCGALPAYYLYPFDRQQLIQDNLADIGVIAHRGGLPEAHFDESLREMGDWDLLLRLTRSKPPLPLPVLACFYSTQEPDRLTAGPTFDADAARVREKAKT